VPQSDLALWQVELYWNSQKRSMNQSVPLNYWNIFPFYISRCLNYTLT